MTEILKKFQNRIIVDAYMDTLDQLVAHSGQNAPQLMKISEMYSAEISEDLASRDIIQNILNTCNGILLKINSQSSNAAETFPSAVTLEIQVLVLEKSIESMNIVISALRDMQSTVGLKITGNSITISSNKIAAVNKIVLKTHASLRKLQPELEAELDLMRCIR